MAYTKLNLTDGTKFTAEHLAHIESGIANVESQIPTDSTNYWSGKKFVMNGDSIPYGSGLSNNKNAFPYLVATNLGMSVTNYSIGGTTIGKPEGAYDECYVDTDAWNAAKEAGTLDTSKKYLVNTGTGAPRIYQIFSWNGSSWVGGGSASNNCARSPLSDRIAAMDTDADLVMIMCGTNDWYYDWEPFGDFETCKYRALGYTGPDSESIIGDLDMTTNLVKSETATLYEGYQISSSSAEPVQGADYFTYTYVPVIAGRQIYAPYARRGWYLNADGDPLSTINITTGTTNYTHTVPDDAAYFNISAKYSEVSIADFAIYQTTVAEGESGSSEGKGPDGANTTFCDALHKLCKYLCETYKGKDIVFLTPIKRYQNNGNNCIYPEDTNGYNKTIKDYRDAIIEACEYYSIPYIDLYTKSGLNPHIHPDQFTDSSYAVHPNVESHQRLASIITAELLSMRK